MASKAAPPAGAACNINWVYRYYSGKWALYLRKDRFPDQFGHFLTDICDEWVRRDPGRVFVQTFEATLRNRMRMSSAGMRVLDRTCRGGPVLEHNGDMYSGDHFVDVPHRLGNITEEHMASLMSSPQQESSYLERARLPHWCRE